MGEDSCELTRATLCLPTAHQSIAVDMPIACWGQVEIGSACLFSATFVSDYNSGAARTMSAAILFCLLANLARSRESPWTSTLFSSLPLIHSHCIFPLTLSGSVQTNRIEWHAGSTPRMLCSSYFFQGEWQKLEGGSGSSNHRVKMGRVFWIAVWCLASSPCPIPMLSSQAGEEQVVATVVVLIHMGTFFLREALTS